MLIAEVSIAHVGRGLKYPEPVPVLSHVAPRWLPEWKHEAKGGAKRWTRKINCLNDPQRGSKALAWWVSLMLKKKQNQKPTKKKFFPMLYYFYWTSLAGLQEEHLDKLHHFISALTVLLCHSCFPVPYVSASTECEFINMATETGQNSLAFF